MVLLEQKWGINMGYYDCLILDEIKKLNKSVEDLIRVVGILADIRTGNILNGVDVNINLEELTELGDHIGPGIAGMSAEEAKAAGWEKPYIRNMSGDDSDIHEDINVNVEAILERADVEWFDDQVLFSRRVISRNPDAPLTDSEKDMLRRMWEAQGCRLLIIFGEAEGE